MSGGLAHRRAIYLARRHLSMPSAEWDALAWWEQQTYLEGYEWEGLIERQEGASPDPTVVATEVHRSGSTTITDRKHVATFSGLPGELSAFGIREQTLG